MRERERERERAKALNKNSMKSLLRIQKIN